MEYHNFDIWIDKKADGKYQVRAVSEHAGEALNEVYLTADSDEIKALQSSNVGREIDQDILIKAGTYLYNKLFKGEDGQVEALFQRCLGEIGGKEDSGLRIRLRVEPAEIAALPWEFIYAPNEGFLSTSIQTPLVRYLDILKPIRELSATTPLKMMVLIPESPGIDADQEKLILQKALVGFEKYVQLTFLEGKVTDQLISDKLIEEQFHILHFIGHGGFKNGEAVLQLNAEDGAADYMTHGKVGDLFHNHLTMKLVVLNSCKGAVVSTIKSFVGMAPQLVKEGIPAVVAMQYIIYDDVAINFAKKFYQSLFKGSERGRVEIAMAHARNELKREFPNERAVGTPVLFMRAPEGILFNLKTGTRWQDIPLNRKEWLRKNAILKTHEKNILFLEASHKASPEPSVIAELDRERAALKSIKQRLKYRKNATIAAAVIVLFLSFLAWVQLFDLFTLDTKVESYTMLFGNFLEDKNYHEKIFVLLMDDSSTAYFKEKGLDGPKRLQHASLIDSLSKYKARVITFDLYFEQTSPYDSTMVSAIKRAKERGTSVVVGAVQLDGTELKLIDTLKGNTSCSVVCIGQKLGYASTAPLTVLNGNHPHLASLSLETYAAYKNGKILDVDFENKQIDVRVEDHTDRVKFSTFEIISKPQPNCKTIQKGDTSVNIIIDLTPIDILRKNSVPYKNIFEEGNKKQFEDAIVLIGQGKPSIDEFSTFHGFREETRFGVELHADAVNTLLNGAVIRSLSQGGQLLIMFLLAMVGGFLRYWKPEMKWTWRLGLLTLAVLLYLAGTIIVYLEFKILLNTIYHLVALLMTFWMVGKIKKKYL